MQTFPLTRGLGESYCELSDVRTVIVVRSVSIAWQCSCRLGSSCQTRANVPACEANGGEGQLFPRILCCYTVPGIPARELPTAIGLRSFVDATVTDNGPIRSLPTIVSHLYNEDKGRK